MSDNLLNYSGYEQADLKYLQMFVDPSARPIPGFIVDFTGTKTRASSVYTEARSLENQVISLPIPADFHSEAIEWIGALKSVATAKGSFTVLELGAGYGAWSVATCVAARKKGIQNLRLYAVEGDPGHYADLQAHCRDNEIPEECCTLIQAAVGTEAGSAKWPKAADPANTWSGKPILEGQSDTSGAAISSYIEVEMLALSNVLAREPSWDLLHIDVQGGEFALCASAIDAINERVRWMVIGTHSRKIDGDLMDLLFRNGWDLVHEKPAKICYNRAASGLEAMTTFDGTQVWQNPRLE